MIRLISTLPLVVLLMAASASLFWAVKDTPVINRDARVQGVFGDWRVPVVSAIYDRSEYLFQIGFGFLQGDTSASSVTEDRGELASPETAFERANKARAAFEESVTLAPGNAYTWSFLAWSRALTADIEGAVDALSVSWELAPRNSQLASSRINLLEVLTEVSDGLLDEESISASALTDMAVLHEHDRRYLNIALRDSPALQALARQSDFFEAE